MREDGKIDYVEWPAGDLPATKAFYAAAFGWAFTDYGPDVRGVRGPGRGRRLLHIAGRLDRAGRWSCSTPTTSRPWMAKVDGGGRDDHRPIFSFPGGRRFHLTDQKTASPGNELAVGSRILRTTATPRPQQPGPSLDG